MHFSQFSITFYAQKSINKEVKKKELIKKINAKKKINSSYLVLSKKNNKYGVISKNKKVILPNKFDEIVLFPNNLILTKKGKYVQLKYDNGKNIEHFKDSWNHYKKVFNKSFLKSKIENSSYYNSGNELVSINCSRLDFSRSKETSGELYEVISDTEFRLLYIKTMS